MAAPQLVLGQAKRHLGNEQQYSVSYASLKELSEQYNLNPKTVAKWKKPPE